MHQKLPHISLIDYYQFITFRTNESIDEYVTKIQEDQSLSAKNKQYQIDKYLDKSESGAYLFGKNINILKNIILEKNNSIYEVDILSIMPNHVHILIKQKGDLSKIMKYIKAKSAIELNKNFKREGKFWLEGYFDKIIRDQKHYDLVYEYILNNPIKASLEDFKERIYSKYEVF